MADFDPGQRAGADRIEAGVVDEPFGGGRRAVVVGGEKITTRSGPLRPAEEAWKPAVSVLNALTQIACGAWRN